uniref:F-box domain-containing protein n=1 Tax=Psilocybe cubensis TaxID=181762 RepID=A0A8H7Y2X9_PSICU
MISDLDPSIVRQSMLQYKQEVETIDREIDNHNQAIQLLLLLKEKRLADIQVCKERLALASRLPTEVLVHIFEEYVLDDMLDVQSLKRGPLVLSHVCCRWRRVASLPALWSYIHGDLLITSHPKELIQMWLNKSHPTPLTINIMLLSHLKGFVLHPAMGAILDEMPRWKHLRLKGRNPGIINAFLAACVKPAPQLRTIDLTVEHTIDPGEQWQVTNIQKAFMWSPQIKSIRIGGHVVPVSDSLPTSLTHFILVLPYQIFSHPQYYQSLLSLVTLLKTLPNLQTLTVEVPLSYLTDFLLDADHMKPIELVNLTSLTLSGPGDIVGLLPRIRAPSLQRLTVSGSIAAAVNANTGQWLLHLLQDSSPPLSHLALVDLTIDDTTYIQLLALLPRLQYLGIHDSDISDIVFQRLYGPTCLCRSLQRLDLRWCQKLSGNVIVDVVRSRSSSVGNGIDGTIRPSPISELTIIHCGLIVKDHTSILQGLTTCRNRRRKHDDLCSQSLEMLRNVK